MAKRTTTRPRAVLVRVGWMRFYGAVPGEDELRGGGSFNDEDVGAEVDNFLEQPDGWLRGYFQPPRGAHGFNLRRIEALAPTGADALEDVLVLMFAKDPEHGGQYLVGWYSNAVCFSEFKTPDDRLHLFAAQRDSCVLVPEPMRRAGPAIPKGLGGTGQANVCYLLDSAGNPHTAQWVEAVLEHVRSYRGPNVLTEGDDSRAIQEEIRPRGGGQGRGLDGPCRRAVELHAMKRATQHFTSEGWEVDDVSAIESYDLRCTRHRKVLHVEVKGTVGTGDSVLLTPNEVALLRAKHPATALYVLHSIALDRSGKTPIAAAGVEVVRRPFDIGTCELKPLGYEVVLPAPPKNARG